MEVELTGIGKRFSSDWILKDLDLIIRSGQHLAVLGDNGSGKSTLLKIISGYLSPSKGTIIHRSKGKILAHEDLYKQLGFVAPYQDVYRKMTVRELCRFHFSLRTWRVGSEEQMLYNLLGLPTDDLIGTFSSGMVQRLKLGLTIHTSSELLLFDEPTMNLDDSATQWFIGQLRSLPKETTVIIASNLPGIETSTCTESMRIRSGRLMK